MTVIRERLAYADPEVVIATLETGDSLPVRARAADGCLACAQSRSPLEGWPCRLNNMPSPMTGRCRCWREA